MKKNNVKSLRVMCYVALVLCAVYGIAVIVQCPGYFLANAGGEYVRWEGENAWIKGLIAIGYVSTALIAILQASCFFFNILKGIRKADFFPKQNIKVLYFLTATTSFLPFFSDNLSMALSANPHGFIVVTDINLLLPLAVFIFTQMYKIAHMAMEDSRLAI